jgi:signal transduction histidine kinase
VVVTTEHRERSVWISIQDQGPGIPEDYKDRIFDKFVQVDATDQRRRGGTGLG